MQLLKYAVQELLLLSKPLLLCPKAKQLVTVLTQLLVVFTEPNLNPFGLPSYLLFQFASSLCGTDKAAAWQRELSFFVIACKRRILLAD